MDSLTILVDFDDTCCRDSYPHRGKEIPGAVSVLRDLCQKGHRLILWTCREHVSIDGVDPLQEALNWFSSYDIPLYAVNEDPCVGSVLKMSNLVDTFLTRLHVMPHSLLRHSIFVF